MKRIGLAVLALLLLTGTAHAQFAMGTVNVRNLLNAQGAATSGQLGVLNMGAVTTGAPTYTTGQTSPISLDTTGNLRVNCIAGCTSPTIPTLTGTAQQAVTASAAALGTNTSKSVCIKVLAAGTQDPIYFGVSGVTTATGMELSVRDSWCGAISNTNQIFVIAAGTGTSVSYEWTN